MLGVVSDQKRNAPNGTKTDECVDDSADHTCLTSADPRYDVKLENTDRTPVDTSDNKKNQ